MWREHRDPKIVESYTETVAVAEGVGLPRLRAAARARVPHARGRPAQAARTCSCWAMLCSIYSLDLQLAREQIALHLRQEGPEGHRCRTCGCWKRASRGARRTSTSSIAIPAEQAEVPQIVVNGNTALALGVLASGHGHLRDVSDHAGDLGVALPVRRVRARRRHRPPGRRRDRRLRVRDRRLVRRPAAR